MNLFHAAIRNRNFKLFSELLANYKKDAPESIDEQEKHTGLTPLQLAVFLGHFDIAVQLLVNGANPNQREDDSLHLLQQSVKQRDFGDIYSSLIYFAPGTDPRVKEPLKNQIKLNAEVFHILFMTALTKENEVYALRLLNETLPSLENGLRSLIIKSFTGALYYAVDRGQKAVALKLDKIGVKRVDPNLPSPGVKFVEWLPKQTDVEEKRIPLNEALKNKSYLDLTVSLTKESFDNMPFETNHLPWRLLVGFDCYGYAMTLIKQKKWDQLKQYEEAGYSLTHHLYGMILRNERSANFESLKDCPRFKEEYYPQLRKMCLFAMRDSLRINEKVLDKILRATSFELSWTVAEEKEQHSVQAKLDVLEKSLINFRASELVLRRFALFKQENLGQNFKSAENKLMQLPLDVLKVVTAFLKPHDIYTGLARVGRSSAALASQDRLSVQPSTWLRYNNIDIQVNSLATLVKNLDSYKRSLANFCFIDSADQHDQYKSPPIGLCSLSFGAPSCIAIPANIVLGIGHCCCAPDCCCSVAALVPAKSTWIITNAALGGTVPLICCIGVAVYYSNRDKLPVRFDYLNAAGKALWRKGVAYLAPGSPEPRNTKDLIQSLQAVGQRLQDRAVLLDLDKRTQLSPIELKENKTEQTTEEEVDASTPRKAIFADFGQQDEMKRTSSRNRFHFTSAKNIQQQEGGLASSDFSDLALLTEPLLTDSAAGQPEKKLLLTSKITPSFKV